MKSKHIGNVKNLSPYVVADVTLRTQNGQMKKDNCWSPSNRKVAE